MPYSLRVIKFFKGKIIFVKRIKVLFGIRVFSIIFFTTVFKNVFLTIFENSIVCLSFHISYIIAARICITDSTCPQTRNMKIITIKEPGS